MISAFIRTVRFFLVLPALLLPSLAVADCTDYPVTASASTLNTLWRADLSQGMAAFGNVTFQFGADNISFVNEPGGVFPTVLRVRYPAGSYDPGTALRGAAPLGGAQFTSRLTDVQLPSSDRYILSFAVRFPAGFNFVRGGKLHGFYGGVPKSGGKIPTGYDGFSTRIVWQSTLGKGALYAYLPTSVVYGDLIGSGSWYFRTKGWMDVTQAVRLNTPGMNNGEVALWIDGMQVHRQCNLVFRHTEKLNIDGIFFSTFFGGNDPSWATPVDTYVDFADFRISKLPRRW